MLRAGAIGVRAAVRLGANTLQKPGVKTLLGGVTTAAGAVNALDSVNKDFVNYQNGDITKEEFGIKTMKNACSNLSCPITKFLLSGANLEEKWKEGNLDTESVVTELSAQMPIDPIAMVNCGSNVFATARWYIESQKLFDELDEDGLHLTGNEIWARQVSLNDRYFGKIGVG